MKIFYPLFVFATFFLPLSSLAQTVRTLTTVTANGGISIDSEGNIYVAHFGPLPPNQSIGTNIYKITPDGTVALFVDGELKVGSGNGFDSQGFLYQSNFAISTIYKIDPSGTIVDANYASVPGPVGITADAADNLYVCSCSTNSVKKISPDGTRSDFVASNDFNCPNGITIDQNDNLYITNFNSGNIYKISPQGETTLLGSTPVGNGHIAFRANDQMLYIASYTGQQIFKMDLSGKVELFAGTGTSGSVDALDPLQASFRKPNGIEISPNGCSLYISQDDDVLREIQFNDSGCLSPIEELPQDSHYRIYPNPASEFLVIDNPKNIEITSIQIFNTQGRAIQVNKPLGVPEIDISQLTAGLYLLLLQEKSGKAYFKKIIVE